VWAGNDGAAIIEFDQDNCVYAANWASENETLLDRLRGWLHV
jgi:hypothetical protein